MGIYKKDNRWYLDYYLPNGRRKREVVSIEGVDPSKINREDAKKALSIRKSEFAQGKFDITKTEKPVKFEKLIEAYLKWADENHKAPERDHAACKNLLSHFKGKNIYTLSLWEIEKYKSERKKQGRKPETINKELGSVRRMFNLSLQGVLSIKVGKNPVQGIKLLKVPKTKPRTYKPWEFQKLYEAATGHFKPILLCAYLTGMRRSEITRLRWQDMDFEDKTIYVAETKNEEPRTIPMSEALFDSLLEMKKDAIGEYVFTTPDGKPYTSLSAWKRAWSTALRKSGIEKGRFHDFRHTFISNLIVNEKEDFATVMALSGHKDISMLKRYSHTQEEAKRAAIDKLGKHFEKSTIDTYLDTKPNIDSRTNNNRLI
ncbi:MAG: site-specific integrase [Candidatus Dadabacteria bacterium]|nr:MAG: site-specific integrase [Candidatus Dadabacteria bacterium]